MLVISSTERACSDLDKDFIHLWSLTKFKIKFKIKIKINVHFPAAPF